MKTLLLGLLCFWPFCNKTLAKEFLAKHGYTKIVITGTRAHVCDNYHYSHTTFEAINPRGIPVDGVVCSGFGDTYIEELW